MAITIRKVNCPNTTIEVNGVTEGTVAAGSTVNVTLEDSLGMVTPVSVTQVGNDFEVVLPDGGVVIDYIVDDYSPLAAYSLRKVSSTATSAIRVRRSSDNAETDIGFVDEDLDLISLFAFVRNNSAYVTTLYDQSGNGKHQRQTSASSQPAIINSGVLVTLLGKPSIELTSSRFLNSSGTIAERLEFATNTRIDTFLLMRQTAFSHVIYAHRIDTSFFNLVGQSGSAASPFTGTVTVDNHYKNGSVVTMATRGNVYTQLATTAPLLLTQINYKNSTQAITGLCVGSYSGLVMQGNITEWFVFTTDQSTNRTAIETNINNYYGIY